jgi:hypothetical protein
MALQFAGKKTLHVANILEAAEWRMKLWNALSCARAKQVHRKTSVVARAE